MSLVSLAANDLKNEEKTKYPLMKPVLLLTVLLLKTYNLAIKTFMKNASRALQRKT